MEQQRAEQPPEEDFGTLLEQSFADPKSFFSSQNQTKELSGDLETDLSSAKGFFDAKNGIIGFDLCQEILKSYPQMLADQRYFLLFLMGNYYYQRFKSETNRLDFVQEGYKLYEGAESLPGILTNTSIPVDFSVATADARFVHSATIDDIDMEEGKDLLEQGYQELSPYFK